jgi:hypothetical protein
MGRKRTRVFIKKPDRVSPDELANWMRVNDISINQLARALSSFMGWSPVKYNTVNGWLNAYRHAPAWLEHRINFIADHGGKLPHYGQRWPEETTSPTPFPAIAAPPLKPATCGQCGAPLTPDGERCTWDFCATNDGYEDDE